MAQSGRHLRESVEQRVLRQNHITPSFNVARLGIVLRKYDMVRSVLQRQRSGLRKGQQCVLPNVLYIYKAQSIEVD